MDTEGKMSRLREMIVDARADAEKAGITFIPIVNYREQPL